jgi:hypothetical protein
MGRGRHIRFIARAGHSKETIQSGMPHHHHHFSYLRLGTAILIKDN